MSRPVIAAVLALAVTACGSVDPDRVPATLRLPSAPDCRPEALSDVFITALGDFPTSDATVEVLAAGGTSTELWRLPESTLALSARATVPTWDGFGYASVEDLRRLPDFLVLPLGRSCVIADPEARLPRGAAIAVLSGSSVLIAGGLDERGLGTRRLAILELRNERVELPSPTLLNRIAFASATLLAGSGAVLVAGGASSEDGDVQDTWERVSLDGARSFPRRPLETPRRDHGSIAIDEGALRGVLLVGGGDGDALLDTIEWVDVDAGISRTLAGRLTTRRQSPSVARLSARVVAIFGGRTEEGLPAPGIDLLDLEAETIVRADVDPGPSEWAVPLTAGRIAVSASGLVSVILEAGRSVADAGSIPAITSPVAVGLPSGRVLVAGRDARGERIAVLFDPSTGTSELVSITPAPTRMLALPDGTTLALDEARASLRRDDRTTPFDSPRPLFLFASDRSELALDAESRWAVDGDALVAQAERSRVDVPVLRLRDLRAALDATGAVSFAFVDAFGAPAALIAIDDASASIGSCRVARAPTDPVRITRRGSRIELTVRDATVHCEGVDLPDRVGIALIAEPDARLRSLALARLP